MAEVILESNDQSLHHLISVSPWQQDDIISKVAERGNQTLEDGEDRCLLIDETSMIKSGSKSVGVARQWSGRLGKVDNCQVGVFGVLGHGAHCVPIDCRLYLPKSWVEDPKRCTAAGVPLDRITYLRKQDLALQIVDTARKRGISFSWVGCDGFYGEDPSFLRSLDQTGEVFMADVHKDQTLWPEDPGVHLPPRRSKRGRPPKKLKAKLPGIRVDKFVEQQPSSAWQRVKVRETTKGDLVVDILHKRVWLWDGKEAKPHRWHLVVRREINGSKLKYSLSNAPAKTPVQRLAFAQAQRYWVERSFQDAKQHSGLDDYQVRGWRGWHHHMAMVMMAMEFMLEQRLKHKELHPLLSCSDIVSLLRFFLPKRAVSEEEVLHQMTVRHKKRQSSIDSANKMCRRRLAAAEPAG